MSAKQRACQRRERAVRFRLRQTQRDIATGRIDRGAGVELIVDLHSRLHRVVGRIETVALGLI